MALLLLLLGKLNSSFLIIELKGRGKEIKRGKVWLPTKTQTEEHFCVCVRALIHYKKPTFALEHLHFFMVSLSSLVDHSFVVVVEVEALR